MAGKFSSPKDGAKPNRVRTRPNIGTAAQLNHEQERIQKWLKGVRFKKAFFGVDEVDLWKKVGELNSLYEAALSAERARYDALLAQHCGDPKHGKAGDDLHD